MTFADVWNFILSHIDTIIAVLTALAMFFKMVKEKVTAGQALVLLGNALQDEHKMVDGQFTPATVAKVENIAATTGAPAPAVTAVTDALTKINDAAKTTGAQNGIKVGSLNGKPVYLDQVVGITAQAQAVAAIFKGLFGKK